MSKSEVERRTVLLAGGAAATTAVLSGCIVQQAAPPPATTQPTSKAPVSQGTTGTAPGPAALAQVADIPAGGGVILKEQNVVLCKDASGKVSAFSAICTHQGCVVTDVADGTINCPCHGSKFDAASGERVAGPAKKPLPPVSVQQRDGAIFQA
ncbi:Rieske (2Fe-2S) protein [Kribbella sancticallisti]|uniref:Rieske (2Fe-2S) protein n=1 Tax=Kribbella sancticallisti TaxID=460087 RepID=UPI0031DAB20D